MGALTGIWKRGGRNGGGGGMREGTREFGGIPKRPGDGEWCGDGRNSFGERGRLTENRKGENHRGKSRGER